MRSVGYQFKLAASKSSFGAYASAGLKNKEESYVKLQPTIVEENPNEGVFVFDFGDQGIVMESQW